MSSKEMKAAYRKVTDAHYVAVQLDTRLGVMDTDDDKYGTLELRCREAWVKHRALEREFLALLGGA